MSDILLASERDNDDGSSRELVKGTFGGVGRAPVAREGKYLRAMTRVVSEEEWMAITRRAVADALEGDFRARDWLSKYLIGPPEFALQAQLETIEDPNTGDKIKKLGILMRNLVSVMEDRDEDE